MPSSISACWQPRRTCASSSTLSTVAVSGTQTLRAGGGRQIEMEHGAAAGRVVGAERAAEIAGDAGGNGETEAEAAIRVLGGEERFEQPRPRLRAEAGTVIGDGNADPA